jgi:hypothetical protein
VTASVSTSKLQFFTSLGFEPFATCSPHKECLLKFPFIAPKLGIFQLQQLLFFGGGEGGSWSLYHNTQIAAKTINQTNMAPYLPPETQTLNLQTLKTFVGDKNQPTTTKLLTSFCTPT